MTATLAALYREQDPDPLTIPARPEIRCRQMPGRVFTYEVWDASAGHVGYLHWRSDGSFRARTFGSTTDAADVRTFDRREKAVAWLETQFSREGR